MSSFCAKKQKRKLNWCHFTCSAAGTWKSSTSAFTGVLLESIYYSWAAVGTSSSLTHVMFYTGDFKSEQIVDTRVLSISEETRWWTFSEQTGPGILGVSRYFAAAHRDIRRGGWWRAAWQTERWARWTRPPPRPEPSLCLRGVTGTFTASFCIALRSRWHLAAERNKLSSCIYSIRQNFNLTSSKRVDGFWETIRPHLQADGFYSDVVSRMLVLKSRSWFTTGTPPHQIPLYALSRSQSVSSPLINLSEPV